MTFPLTWTSFLSEANYAIIMITVGFILFWFSGQSTGLLRWLSQRYGADRGQAIQVFSKRIIGMIVFGLIPTWVLVFNGDRTWSDYGMAVFFPPAVWYWTFGLSALFIFMNSRATQKPDHLAQYPEIRTPIWSRSLVAWSALSWVGYLFAYELMFRGFLLFACARAFGAWPAIIINTAIYALVHVPKSANEGIGAIPLGLLLCIITFQTQTIWVALFVHWVLAISNEWFSLQNQLVMRVNR